ncbi:MAG: FAD-binding oxidoreductase [Kordiimonadaceae bacterium]|jgi:gamma-glutamylputrescine oxidase|nr:FAD-binding oxidoreductase [Kordiimonadaceae bacterium]MBT6034957.1 FAD-binding oxidoreductase [Kordiimonadaceae bacterium]MBT6330502.1 FAD-binding oxidoreductase [Kordiimonadaceae bacterium]MBT7582974.1 FAD-binding oxidoreductase [Kordiimonadaceae bacterium]
MRISDHIHSNEYPASYYAATCNDTAGFSALSGDETFDVCIIGGGFSGVATALHLSERGFKVCVVEQNKIGWGATGRNGGHIIGGYAYSMWENKSKIDSFGEAGTKALWDMSIECVDIIKNWVEKYNIDCDLEFGFIDVAMKKSELEWLKKSADTLADRNYPYETKILNKEELSDYVVSDQYIGGRTNDGWGQAHVLNLVLGEARAAEKLGATIYEHAEVSDIIHGARPRVVTKTGTITADFVVVTGNGYLGNLVPKLASRVLPAGSYIIATEPLSDEQIAATAPKGWPTCDQRWALDYFRVTNDKRLLFGGMATYSGRHPKNIKAVLEPKLHKVFPILKDVKIDYEWGGYMGIGLNRIPMLGRLSDNVYFATGYGGHGVAPTHMSAKLISEAIAGQAERYDIVASVKHMPFPGGRHLMQPAYAVGMAYYKLRDAIGW